MDESRDNENNEQIYESIAECVRQHASHERNDNNLPGGHQLGSIGNEKPGVACYGLAVPFSAATAKRAFKTGANKLCGTMNSVCTKFGTLSQKLRRSTRRRTPLVNSPGTPMGKSHMSLGRTPTKLYSPFSIETPRGKENVTARRNLNRESFKKSTPPKSWGPSGSKVGFTGVSRFAELRSSPRLNNDLQQAQIGIVEFHHTADRIINRIRR